MSWILEPWPWYVSGPLLGLIVPLLYIVGSSFGVSSNIDTICSVFGARRLSDYFNFSIRDRHPNLLFLAGAVAGGFLTSHFLTAQGYAVYIADATEESIQKLGIDLSSGLLPVSVFNWSNVLTFSGFVTLVIGGFLIGFGTRYAGGCTSGHSITGLSNLQLPSLVATIGFFIGGLLTTHFLLPLLYHP